MAEFDAVFRLSDINGVNGLRLSGADDNADFGRAIAGAGDVNGDGFADLIFGARDVDFGGSQRGAAYVVFGGTHLADLDAANGAVDGELDINDLDGTNGFEVFGQIDNERVGWSVAAAGDVDGDGFDDVIIGAPGNSGINDSGRATIIFGAASFSASVPFAISFGSTKTFNGVGTNNNDDFGYSVSSAGDFDGDGFDDVVITAQLADPITGAGNGTEGAAYLVRGGDSLNALDFANGFADGFINIANIDTTPESGAIFGGETGNTNARLGTSVSAAGDVNGDGFGDFIVGSRQADPISGTANDNEGAAYIVFGRADLSGINSPERLEFNLGLLSVELVGVDAGDRLGQWVGGDGDINGDGYDDVIVTAAYADGFGSSANSTGSAYVVFGKPIFGKAIDIDGLDGTNGFRMDGVRSSDYTGISASIAGDLNGDGFDDLAVAAHFFDQVNYNNSGAVYVVFGKADGFDAVIDLGALDGDSGFRVDGPEEASAILGRGMSGPAGDVNGDGFDDLVLAAYREHTGSGNNNGAGYVVYGHKAQDSVVRVGTSQSQKQNGGFGDDLIQGNDGNDTLIGHEGNDTIEGGANKDLILGGAEDDVLDGGGGRDTVSYADAEEGVTVSLKLLGVYQDTGGSGFDRLHSFEALIGSDHDDVLTGNEKDNIFDGGAGDDFINGKGGSDTAVYFNATSGVAVSLLIVGDQNTGGAGVDHLNKIEHLTGSLFDDDLAGSTLDNLLNANAGDDTVFGSDGNDTILGGTGQDNLIGGSGDDDIQGNKQADTIDGGKGNDTIDGGNGGDVIIGGKGNDIVLGRTGNDTIDGGNGNDDLQGGANSDVITGGAGRDTLSGGEGSVGDNEADTFVFATASDSGPGLSSRDTIRDFEIGADTMDLTGIDAIVGGGDDPFSFIGNAGFSGTAGQLRFFNSGPNTIVAADTDGDSQSDFEVLLEGNLSLTIGDFLL